MSTGGSRNSGAVGGVGIVDSGGANGDAGAGGENQESVGVGCAKRLASGDAHTCILFEDGRLACIGENEHAQLGLGNVSAPMPLVNARVVDKIAIVAAGGARTCTLLEGGVYCWGDNSGSGIGVPSSELTVATEPTRVISTEQLFPAAVVQLALGRHHGCALNAVVHGVCWGTNERGDSLIPAQQLGQIGYVPLQVLQLGNAEIRLLDDGRLSDVSWRSTTAEQGLATVRGARDGVIENAIGVDHDCLLKRSGMVFCRGAGYLADYTIVAEFGREVVEIKAGKSFTCARTSSGKVLCRRGFNDGSGIPVPSHGTVVPELDSAVELSMGADHACARLLDGSVWCWGRLPGDPFQEFPTRVSAPLPGQTCATGATTSDPWNRPPLVKRLVDVLSDAALAWGQNQCLCALSAGTPADIADCAEAETTVLHGCLQALASAADDEVNCRADEAWRSVECSLSCLGTGTLPIECHPNGSCPIRSGVVDFCTTRRLICDPNATEGGFVSATRTCDGVRDCANGFDEANCTPNAGQFRCADGTTIALEGVHDGVAQCADSSDESFFSRAL